MSLNLYPPSVGSSESTIAAPWYMQVARGLVPGASVVNVYGYQNSFPGSTASSGAFSTVWELNTNASFTPYAYPSSAIQMLLYSTTPGTPASDINVSVLINGLDASYNPISETLTLTNGATGVTTVNSYLRINSIQTVGSVNALGTLYLSNSGKTVTYAVIALTGGVSNGKSQMMIYTVPNGYTFYLTRSNAYSSLNGNTAGNYSYYRVYTQSNTGVIQTLLQAPFTNEYGTLRVAPRPYTQKTDIQWQVAAAPTSASAVGIGVEGILISNTAV